MKALPKIWFFHIVKNRAKIPFLRKLNISDQTRIAQNVCALTKGGTILKWCAQAGISKLAMTCDQAFSQELKVGRPRSMFLVNYLKD